MRTKLKESKKSQRVKAQIWAAELLELEKRIAKPKRKASKRQT